MRFFLIGFILAHSIVVASAQDDLLSLIEDETEEETLFTSALWKTTRVINLQSLENVAAGTLDFRISHRFGFVNQGIYEFFGLDNASIRLALEMGITDRLMIGFGRSRYQKAYDGFLKYKLLRQSTGKRKMPISVSAFSSVAVNTLRSDDPDVDVLFSSRLSFAFQVIIGRKFSSGFTAQISPTLIHRNLVETTSEKNDVYALGFAARQKIGKRLSINAEYIYVFPDQVADIFTNSLSIGIDIETGGHVFQLHFTNSTAMIEKGFIAENTGEFFKGDIRFGFNISRVFTLWDVNGKLPR
jgi:uncharacterized beta barrel domain-containing protein DUF5777